MLILVWFVSLLAIVVVLVKLFYDQERARTSLRDFKSSIHIENNILVLPEKAFVEYGTLKITGRWVQTYRGQWYHLELSVENTNLAETRVVNLETLCNQPFYTYVDYDGNTHIVAPGFIIKSGRFEGIIGLCLNQDTIPLRRLELKTGIPLEEAFCVVELSKSCLRATVRWIFRARTMQKVFCDPKTGFHRVVEEHVEKPKAQGVRVEVCYPTSSKQRRCFTLARVSAPNTTTIGEYAWSLTDNFVFIHKKVIGSDLYKVVTSIIKTSSSERKVVAGYRPGLLKLRLILDMPMSRDIIQEAEL